MFTVICCNISGRSNISVPSFPIKLTIQGFSDVRFSFEVDLNIELYGFLADTITFLSFASFTRADQLRFVCNVLALPKIHKESFALVKATFIRLTSATNPILEEFPCLASSSAPDNSFIPSALQASPSNRDFESEFPSLKLARLASYDLIVSANFSRLERRTVTLSLLISFFASFTFIFSSAIRCLAKAASCHALAIAAALLICGLEVLLDRLVGFGAALSVLVSFILQNESKPLTMARIVLVFPVP
nr:hypothetical protein VIGAN_07001300 [Ipomoea trifida]